MKKSFDNCTNFFVILCSFIKKKHQIIEIVGVPVEIILFSETDEIKNKAKLFQTFRYVIMEIQALILVLFCCSSFDIIIWCVCAIVSAWIVRRDFFQFRNKFN